MRGGDQRRRSAPSDAADRLGVDDSHRDRRCGRCLRQRHLLERLRLRRDRARHGRPGQQHDGRGGPQSSRFPQHPAGSADAVDDVADAVATREGEVELVLGSAGSNRIRSAILQTLIRVLAELGGGAAAAVAGTAAALRIGPRPRRARDRRGRPRGAGRPRGRLLAGARTSTSAASRRSSAIPETGALDAAGDPRRGGAAVLVYALGRAQAGDRAVCRCCGRARRPRASACDLRAEAPRGSRSAACQPRASPTRSRAARCFVARPGSLPAAIPNASSESSPSSASLPTASSKPSKASHCSAGVDLPSSASASSICSTSRERELRALRGGR